MLLLDENQEVLTLVTNSLSKYLLLDRRLIFAGLLTHTQ